MNGPTISYEPGAAESDRRVILDGLVAYGDDRTDSPRRDTAITLLLRDSGGVIVGGLLSRIVWQWLLIDGLWIHETLRAQGYGSRLLSEAEARAVALGCQDARLDTFDFEARNFYERHGYRVYAQLDGFPSGHTQYH